MTKIYHTSPLEITNINKYGQFGDCLFFSSEVYSMGNVAKTYSMDVECIEASSFFYQDDCEKLDSIVSDIMNYFDTDEETAQNLLDSTADSFDFSDDYEASFYVQAKQGEAGKALGYDGAESEDEQGAVYIIPMLGREKDLTEVK